MPARLALWVRLAQADAKVIVRTGFKRNRAAGFSKAVCYGEPREKIPVMSITRSN